MALQRGQRIRPPGWARFATVADVLAEEDGVRLYLHSDDGSLERVAMSHEEAQRVEILTADGSGDPSVALAGLWSAWMRAAAVNARASARAATPLRPYAHQQNAVYGTMLPQPRLRFLLADEPGTGKTIMGGLYVREMQRLGLVRRALIVAPAHLVEKWREDFERFFGGGLARVYAQTAQEGPLRPDQDLWVVSLDLAAVNPRVQEVIGQDAAGWDLVVIDEAHRLTPTAQTYYRVGRGLCLAAPRLLLMTATPHRGKEWLFRSLMHLVDPEVFPEVDASEAETRGRLRPGPVHFLRRMKEELVDYDGVTPLFRGRRAENVPVPLNAIEAAFYREAMEMVERFFPREATALASIVYGKRVASSLYAFRETLRRRLERMGTDTPRFAADRDDPDLEDPAAREEAEVVVERSRAAREERRAIDELLGRLDPLLASAELPVSKWSPMLERCLAPHGIVPGAGEQAVIFTEFADSADWLVDRLNAVGYSPRRYSGRDAVPVREDVRRRFERREFDVIVSTDAGNEGIDLQTAHVLVNWDIPWSLVRLEQRMGRIHRIGQQRDVELYSLVATDTREGDVLATLLGNFVVAANAMGGRLFDSLGAVADALGLDAERLLARTHHGDPVEADRALAEVRRLTAERVRQAAERFRAEENRLASPVDVEAAVAGHHREALERINPRIVEAYLARLTAAGVVRVTPHAGGSGLFVLERPDHNLPSSMGAAQSALVASSARAAADARSAGARLAGVVILGPGEPAFRDLIDQAAVVCEPSVFAGATLVDPASITDYDVFLYEATVGDPSGREAPWPFLVRADEIGARPLPLEAVANLTVGHPPRGGLHPARAGDADATAARLAAGEERQRREELARWVERARQELERLPSAFAAEIEDAARRRETRRTLEEVMATRLAELRAASEVRVGQPRRLGWARVIASADAIASEELDSDQTAMHVVARILRAEEFRVADVHQDRLGYDLLAVRGREQRCVEVKGVKGSAASEGIRMTGGEVLMARQLAGEYWLYVVDRCDTGGTLYGAFRDPARLFEEQMTDVSVVRVPGSALKAAREEAEAS